LLGVASPNSLTECSKVLPPAVTSFFDPDEDKINKWLDSDDWSPKATKIAGDVDNGDNVPPADDP
jgi:hypothetical protein